MKVSESRKHLLLIILTCILLLIPLVLISMYARPSADDYDALLHTRDVIKENGSLFDYLTATWNGVVRFYMTWQGTYATALWGFFLIGLYGYEHYFLTPLLFLGIAWLSLFVAAYYINKRLLKKSLLHAIAVSVLMLTVLILWMPSPVQGLYWFSGAMHYIPWFFGTVVNITLLLEAGVSETKRPRVILVILCSILSFLISGGSQVTAFANILLLLALLIFAPARKRSHILLPLFFAVLGFVIMFMAPGNSVRAGQTETRSVVETVYRVARHSIPLLTEWISLNWVLSLALMTPLVCSIAEKNTFHFSKWVLLILPAVSYAVICGMLSVHYMPTGQFGDGRVTNVIWFAFMLLSWLNYGVFYAYFHENGFLKIKPIPQTWLHTGLTVLCLLLLFAGNSGYKRSNSFTACLELVTGEAKQYAQELDLRQAAYLDESIKEVAVAPLSVKPEIIFYMDIEPDPYTWPNYAVVNYYNKELVYIAE